MLAAIRLADAIRRRPWLALDVRSEASSAHTVRAWKRIGYPERAKECSRLQSEAARNIHQYGGTL